MTEPYIPGPIPTLSDASPATRELLRYTSDELDRIALQANETALVQITDFNTSDWIDFPGTSFPVTAYALDGDRIYLQGAAQTVTAGASSQRIFTLPPPARPLNTQIFLNLANSAGIGSITVRLDILTSGSVFITSTFGNAFAIGSWVTFNGITYRRDAT